MKHFCMVICTLALAHLATAVQQLSGGIREALQAIYEEVD